MKFIIHRGAHEIGGSCVELKTDKTRLIIDFGLPLVNPDHTPFDSKTLLGKSIKELKELKILPTIPGFYKDETKKVDGLIISHAHLDHYGLLSYVHPDIPIFISQGAKELMNISVIFTPSKVSVMNPKIIEVKKPFSIGDFLVTPHLVDHSAFDALAFLIEAEGRRVFYSGDFRGHGRKSNLFKAMIKKPPSDIDCLLMEGSSLGRGDKAYPSEISVENKIREILNDSNNITFLFVSSQNIDRLVSAYKACLKSNHIFIIDIYTAYVLDKLKSVSVRLPQFNWCNIRVKFLKNQADALARAVSPEQLYIYDQRKIGIDEINQKKNQILMVARDNSIFPAILRNIDHPEGAKVIYSMWEGYLTEKFKSYCETNRLIIEKVHTSGHANIDDLREFANAIKAKQLIPIHTFEAKAYPRYFSNVKILEDGKESGV